MYSCRHILLIVLGLVALLKVAEGAKILVFLCQMGRSHHIVFQPIIRELAARGHEVDYYTHHPLSDPPPTLKQIELSGVDEVMKEVGKLSLKEFAEMSVVGQISFLRTWKFKNNMHCYKYPEVQQLLLSNKKYELVLGEFYFLQEDLTVFIHKFNALGVGLSSHSDSAWVNEMSGLPDNPAYMVDYNVDYTNKMSFYERLVNVYAHAAASVVNSYYVITEFNDNANEHYTYEGWEGRPNVYDLSKDLALVLINSHHSVGFSYPRAPHVKEVLGTNVEENPKPLPKDVQKFMDEAEHGVIYFSMGSIVDVRYLQETGAYDALMNVMKKLKLRVLWKWTSWDGVEMPPMPEHIKMVKWLPQLSVLGHNKTKVFITHCGFGGLVEGVAHGVPMVGMPFYADQFKNAKFMETCGFGVKLNVHNLTEDQVSWALEEVLSNPSYKAEALRRQNLFHDRPMKPIQEAVYWIEYVLKHGKVLQPASVHLPFYQLYLLDVMGFILFCCALAIFLLKKLCCIVLRFVRNIFKSGKSPVKLGNRKKTQ